MLNVHGIRLQCFKYMIMIGCVGMVTSPHIQGITYGSDSTPSRSAAQLTLAQGDRVAGFIRLDGGFLVSNNSTATWDSFFPVAGRITFNNASTLLLNLDLILADRCSIVSLGNINAQGRAVQLCSTVTFIPASQAVNFSNTNLIMNNDLALNRCRITFQGTSEINGNGCTLDLLSTTTLLVAANSRLTLRDVCISGVTGTNIQGVAATSRITFENCILNLTNNYIFGIGGFDVLGLCKLVGSNKYFTYTTDQVSTISAYGTLMIDAGMTFSYAPRTNVRSNLIFENNQAQLMLNSATFATSNTGILLRKGFIGIEGKSFFNAANVLKSGSITLGDGVSVANDAVLHVYPSATLVLTNGFLQDNNV